MAKVVVVDDAPEVVTLVRTMLQDAGHEIVDLPNEPDLEVRIAEERPAVLLLDVVMPERNGYQILRSLRRQDATRRLPVVLISSKKEESDIEWGKMQGAADYLTKPFTAEQLSEAVARQCEP
ncbi:MAG: response regulator [Acidobacteriota bacterium]